MAVEKDMVGENMGNEETVIEVQIEIETGDLSQWRKDRNSP